MNRRWLQPNGLDKMTHNLALSEELVCRLHLIWMSDAHDDPKDPTVRILLVTTRGVPAVYEGLGPWSCYSNWVRNLFGNDESDRHVAPGRKPRLGNRFSVRNRLTTLTELRISTSDLVLHGFYRVDN